MNPPRTNFIPIHAIGPGSQPEQPGDEAWSCLPLPAQIETYQPPSLPQPNGNATAAVQDLLRGMIEAMEASAAHTPPLAFDLAGLDADAHRLLAQVFGEGELSARAALSDGVSVQIQEARYAGVWRVLTLGAQGERLGDHVEIGPLPAIVLRQAASGAARAAVPPLPGSADSPDGPGQALMNAPAIAHEIAAMQAKAVECGGAGSSHVINFSLLPVSPADIAWLEQMLGEGTVGLFSTGYGKCMVMATALRHVWRVRYFDGSNKVLLDTVEITRVPEVVLASHDDLADSLQHLREIVQWLEPR